MSWAEDYKRMLREDSALSVPVLDLETLADRLDIPLDVLKQRRRYRDDLRKAEREIAAEHLGRMRAQALAGEARNTQVAEEEEEDQDLPLALERYLDIYRELDDRMEAVRALQGEGIPIELDDVLQAMQQYPAFQRAMERIWREGNVEAEDRLRKRARGGKSDAAIRQYLQGNMPEKYGNRVRVDVNHRHQLDDGHRELVAEIKGGILPPKGQSKAARSTIQPEDVVEAEVLS